MESKLSAERFRSILNVVNLDERQVLIKQFYTELESSPMLTQHYGYQAVRKRWIRFMQNQLNLSGVAVLNSLYDCHVLRQSEKGSISQSILISGNYYSSQLSQPQLAIIDPWQLFVTQIPNWNKIVIKLARPTRRIAQKVSGNQHVDLHLDNSLQVERDIYSQIISQIVESDQSINVVASLGTFVCSESQIKLKETRSLTKSCHCNNNSNNNAVICNCPPVEVITEENKYFREQLKEMKQNDTEQLCGLVTEFIDFKFDSWLKTFAVYKEPIPFELRYRVREERALRDNYPKMADQEVKLRVDQQWLDCQKVARSAADEGAYYFRSDDMFKIWIQMMHLFNLLGLKGIRHNDPHMGNVRIIRLPAPIRFNLSFSMQPTNETVVIQVESEFICKLFDWDHASVYDAKVERNMFLDTVGCLFGMACNEPNKKYDYFGFFLFLTFYIQDVPRCQKLINWFCNNILPKTRVQELFASSFQYQMSWRNLTPEEQQRMPTIHHACDSFLQFLQTQKLTNELPPGVVLCTRANMNNYICYRMPDHFSVPLDNRPFSDLYLTEQKANVVAPALVSTFNQQLNDTQLSAYFDLCRKYAEAQSFTWLNMFNIWILEFRHLHSLNPLTMPMGNWKQTFLFIYRWYCAERRLQINDRYLFFACHVAACTMYYGSSYAFLNYIYQMPIDNNTLWSVPESIVPFKDINHPVCDSGFHTWTTLNYLLDFRQRNLGNLAIPRLNCQTANPAPLTIPNIPIRSTIGNVFVANVVQPLPIPIPAFNLLWGPIRNIVVGNMVNANNNNNNNNNNINYAVPAVLNVPMLEANISQKIKIVEEKIIDTPAPVNNNNTTNIPIVIDKEEEEEDKTPVLKRKLKSCNIKKQIKRQSSSKENNNTNNNNNNISESEQEEEETKTWTVELYLGEDFSFDLEFEMDSTMTKEKFQTLVVKRLKGDPPQFSAAQVATMWPKVKTVKLPTADGETIDLS
jgi:hypothetical protein